MPSWERFGRGVFRRRRQDAVRLEPLQRAPFDVLIGGIAQNGQAAAREPHATHAALLAWLVRSEGIPAMQHPVIVDDCDLALLQRHPVLVSRIRKIVPLQSVEGVARPVRDIGSAVVAEPQHDRAVAEFLEDGAIECDLVVAAVADAAVGREDVEELRIAFREIIEYPLDVDQHARAAARRRLPALQHKHLRRHQADVLVAVTDQALEVGPVGVRQELLRRNAVVFRAIVFPFVIDHGIRADADDAVGVGANVRLHAAEALGDLGDSGALGVPCLDDGVASPGQVPGNDVGLFEELLLSRAIKDSRID